MYIILTALKNLRRYAGRYLLFGALIFVALAVGTVSLGADLSLAERNAALLEQYGTHVRLVKLAGVMGSDRKVTHSALRPSAYDPIRDMEEIELLAHVRCYFDIFPHNLAVDGRSVNGEEVEQTLRDFKLYFNKNNQILVRALQNERQPSLHVVGIDFEHDPQVNRQTVVENNMLYAGRLPENENECCLNHNFRDLTSDNPAKVELADAPDVGSTVTLTLGETVREFTVVGILGGYSQTGASGTTVYTSMVCPVVVTYETAHEIVSSGLLDDYYILENDRINTTLGPETLPAILGNVVKVEVLGDGGIHYELADGTSATPTPTERYSSLSTGAQSGYRTELQLRDHTLFPAFRDKVEALSGNYRAELLDAGAEELVETYTEAAEMTRGFLIAVIALAATVILIMTALSMHERKYEIGVLLSMGMRKGKIATLFAAENLIFTLIIAALAYATGLAIAPTAAEKMFERSVTVLREAVAAPVGIRMLALAVGLSVPASVISSLAILRFKPMTILRSRT